MLTNNFISRKFKNEKTNQCIGFNEVIENSNISIVLGEPASGKTYQFETYKKQNPNSIFVELMFIDEEDDIEESIEIVLLDSIDEALSKNDSDKALVRKLTKYIKKCKKINPNVKFVISCRYVEWKEIFQDKLEEIDKDLKVYSIEELNNEDIELLLMKNYINKDEFWNFIEKNYLEQLLKNILMTLHIINNLTTYKDKQLKYFEIYEKIIEEHLLAETDNERKNQLKEISLYDMVKISSVVAIYMTLSRTRTVSIENINRFASELYILDGIEITGKKLDIIFHTALFSGKRQNIRFFHKSVQEYLTAYFINLKKLDIDTIQKIFAHSMGFYEEFEEVIIYLTNIELRYFKYIVDFDPFIFRRHPYLLREEQKTLFIAILITLDKDEQRGWNKWEYIENSSLVKLPLIQKSMIEVLTKFIQLDNISYVLNVYLISLLEYNYSKELEDVIFEIFENIEDKKLCFEYIGSHYVNNVGFNKRLLNYIFEKDMIYMDSGELQNYIFFNLYNKIDFKKLLPILANNIGVNSILYYPNILQRLSNTHLYELFEFLMNEKDIKLNDEQLVYFLLNIFHNYKYFSKKISLESIDKFITDTSIELFSFIYHQGALKSYNNINIKNLFINRKEMNLNSPSVKFVFFIENLIKNDKDPIANLPNKLEEKNITLQDIELKIKQWIINPELDVLDDFYIIMRDKIKTIDLTNLDDFIKRLKILYTEKYLTLKYEIKKAILYFIALDKESYQYLKAFWIKNIEKNHYYLRYMIQSNTNESINDFKSYVFQKNIKISFYKEDKNLDIINIDTKQRNHIKYLLSNMGYIKIKKRQYNFVAKIDNISKENLNFLIINYYECFKKYQLPIIGYRLDEYAVMSNSIHELWNYLENTTKHLKLLEELATYEVKRLSIQAKYILEKVYNLQLKNREFDSNYYKNILDDYKNNQNRFFNYEKLKDDLIEISLIETKNRNAIFKESEDETNDRFRNALHYKNYNVFDQPRGGESSSGINAGKRDLVVFNSKGIDESVIEAFILTSLDSTIINKHYEKLVKRYDTVGNRVNFILVYSKTKNFDDLWKKYVKYDGFDKFIDTKDKYSQKDNVRVGISEYEKMEVYHLFINFYSYGEA
ncbi:MAG: Unknown protein [uncultured Sulfurovum sp.]|uniref:Uncharacterized protein n=1 Tax=uncultured Sulfurovum sp. TaxID=269237 RepID=A0A6S6TDB2_9BACT|nr:MAG: Unknown protein [uncultured Sulfurovum sp.]